MADKGGGGGAPMWMVTFADLMALLLTLFVLLLTFAEMDVVKYKAVAGALSEAFGATRKEQLAGVIEIDGSLRRKTAADVNVTKPEEEIEQFLAEAMAGDYDHLVQTAMRWFEIT